jgi:hypothetical protein
MRDSAPFTTFVGKNRQINRLCPFRMVALCRTFSPRSLFDAIRKKILVTDQFLSYAERCCSSCISSSSKVFGTGIKVPCREQHSQGPSQVFPGHSCLGHFFSISSSAWCIASFASSAPFAASTRGPQHSRRLYSLTLEWKYTHTRELSRSATMHQKCKTFRSPLPIFTASLKTLCKRKKNLHAMY